MRRRLAASALALATLTTGCRGTGLIFHDDHHLKILEPSQNAAITLPLTVRWSADASLFTSRSGAKRFVVFVDRPPIKPGQKLRAVAGHDEVCKRDPQCPDEAYLEQNNVYVTTGTHVTLPGLANNQRQSREGARDAHVVTIVLVDDAGRRVDERAFSVEFTVSHLTCRGGNGSKVSCQ